MVCTEISAEHVNENSPVSFEFDEIKGGGAVVITRVNGELIAFSAKCPHAGGDFREGEIHRGRAFCPVHQWKFDLKTGRCVGDESYRLKKYVITLKKGLIFLS